ncbi:hypothetical protein JTE90_000538 [Oedothorax gibbosus]|uniref:Uncharacterized protein n=1 Tax=Oedothorax gibbosus TaxID=931172 RepID=A0AAV6VU34_9ARAC|nr:hypothetical protein JTE90_000538 [Oedothorax gibbosus]
MRIMNAISSEVYQFSVNSPGSESTKILLRIIGQMTHDVRVTSFKDGITHDTVLQIAAFFLCLNSCGNERGEGFSLNWEMDLRGWVLG